jgi:hypothetical protein
MVGNGTLATPKNAFCVTESGWACAETGFVAGAADFAEWFESIEPITPFVPVYLDSFTGKVQKLTVEQHAAASIDPKYIIGISSANPLLVGNHQEQHVRDFLGNYVRKFGNYCSSKEKIIQGSSDLFIVQHNGNKYLSNQITSTTFFDHLNQQTHSLLSNTTYSSTEGQSIKVYEFINEENELIQTIDENQISLLSSNAKPRSEDHSLIGLAGQLLIHSDYRPYNNLPTSWVILKQNHTVIHISSTTGTITQLINIGNGQTCDVVLGQIDPPAEDQTIYYDSILIK